MSSSIRRRVLAATALVALAALSAATVMPGASAAPTVSTAVTDNGVGNLQMSLTPTSDNRILVSWISPAPVNRVKDWVVQTSTARSLVPDHRRYTATASASSLVVPRASLVTAASGDYTFVKVTLERDTGSTGSSPTKWIKAPVLAPPATASKVVIGSFNVRTWGVESSPADRRSWKHRRASVVADIVSSGAGVVAVQEASGSSQNKAYGGITQYADLLRLLQRQNSSWRLADSSLYGAYSVHGRQGNRILYDSSLYSVVGHGVQRAKGSTSNDPAWMGWARFKDRLSGSTFQVVSVHFEDGVDKKGSKKLYNLRLTQSRAAISLVKNRLAKKHDQVYLAGDFNSTSLTLPNNGVHRTFVKAGFFDAFATRNVTGDVYPTTNSFVFPVRESPYRRDYIMGYGPLKGSYWYHNLSYRTDVNTASDHFMQVAQLPF